MKKIYTLFILFFLVFTLCTKSEAQSPRFKVLAVAEGGGWHIEYTKAAKVWLAKLSADSNFTVDYLTSFKTVNKTMLQQYQLILQLDFPPYTWPQDAQDAFVEYIEQGKGGWVGFHHATLLGEFDGYKMWPWFSNFMGGIRYKNYIADFASAVVNVEDKKFPIMKGVPGAFPIITDEWYTYDKSPRLSKDIHVIASVDENTYIPVREQKMGDHPVIWTNTKMKAKNVYIFMGHSPNLFDNPSYTTMVKNAIFWAASKGKK